MSRSNFNKIIIMILVFLLLFNNNIMAEAIKSERIRVEFNKINLLVDGKAVESDNILYRSTTYIPIRAVAQILDKKVVWNGENNIVYIRNFGEDDGNKPVEKTLVTGRNTIDVRFNSVKLIVLGSMLEEDNILYNGTTYIPIRAAAEALDMEVDWEKRTNTANIIRPKVEDKEKEKEDKKPVLSEKDLKKLIDRIQDLDLKLEKNKDGNYEINLAERLHEQFMERLYKDLAISRNNIVNLDPGVEDIQYTKDLKNITFIIDREKVNLDSLEKCINFSSEALLVQSIIPETREQNIIIIDYKTGSMIKSLNIDDIQDLLKLI